MALPWSHRSGVDKGARHRRRSWAARSFVRRPVPHSNPRRPCRSTFKGGAHVGADGWQQRRIELSQPTHVAESRVCRIVNVRLRFAASEQPPTTVIRPIRGLTVHPTDAIALLEYHRRYDSLLLRSLEPARVGSPDNRSRDVLWPECHPVAGGKPANERRLILEDANVAERTACLLNDVHPHALCPRQFRAFLRQDEVQADLVSNRLAHTLVEAWDEERSRIGAGGGLHVVKFPRHH